MEATFPGGPIGFFDALVQYETHLWALLERRLAEHRLPGLGRIWAARSIRRHHGAGRVHELHRDLGITAGAASKLVDRLVHDRLVAREPHPEDRRSSLLSLTVDGARALDEALTVIDVALAEALTGESASVGRLTEDLRLLDEHLSASVPA